MTTNFKSFDQKPKWSNTVRARIKEKFRREGVTVCEKCGADNYLGFAHRLKQRKIYTQEEMETVALLCQTHHEEIERFTAEDMFKAITEIIEARK